MLLLQNAWLFLEKILSSLIRNNCENTITNKYTTSHNNKFSYYNTELPTI